KRGSCLLAFITKIRNYPISHSDGKHHCGLSQTSSIKVVCNVYVDMVRSIEAMHATIWGTIATCSSIVRIRVTAAFMIGRCLSWSPAFGKYIAPTRPAKSRSSSCDSTLLGPFADPSLSRGKTKKNTCLAMDVDLDWCLICSQRTKSELYCSEECRLQDCSSEDSGLDLTDPAFHPHSPNMSPYSANDPSLGSYFMMPLTPPGDSPLPTYSIPHRSRAPSTSSNNSSNMSSCPTLSFSRRSSTVGTLPQLPTPSSQLGGNGVFGLRYNGDLFGQTTILSKPPSPSQKRQNWMSNYNELVTNILSSF
ncbi:hypothetical protein BC938DRAFT_474271, partial [Jimgerdemannia flammicorona]